MIIANLINNSIPMMNKTISTPSTGQAGGKNQSADQQISGHYIKKDLKKLLIIISLIVIILIGLAMINQKTDLLGTLVSRLMK